MRRRHRSFRGSMLAVATFCVLFAATEAICAESPKVPPVGAGKLVGLSVSPNQVQLVGTDAVQQLVVSGEYANGGVQDVTRRVKYIAVDANIATANPLGVVLPQANGQTQLSLQLDGQSVSLPVAVVGADVQQPINFANEIMPILTKLGCNNGNCHGKAEGQNGFKLSLLGFDPVADYEAIVHEARGRRVLESAPAHSLLLLKPTGQLGHGGGKPLAIDSPEHALIERWIARGTPFGSDDDPTVVDIELTPKHRLLGKSAAQQLAVAALYSNGTRKDVTRQAEFQSNDAELVDVTESGLVETLDRSGEGSIMIRYMGQVAVFRATIPLPPCDTVAKVHQPANFIDELTFAKHRQLGYRASALCSDAEFLRRASLDVTGTLPTPEQVLKFMQDTDAKKREKLIDNLLNRPEYAAYWALRWSDILRVRGGSSDNTKTKVEGLNTRAVKFHAWIRQSLAENKPYDQFVREIVTTDGITTGSDAKPPILWYLELKNAERLVEDTAQAFLGTRIQCARCHHHPFEKWSQDDYWGMARFFGGVEWRQGVDSKGKRVKEPRPIRDSEAGRLGQLVAFNPDRKLTDPQGREYTRLIPLGDDELDAPASEDPRDKLVAWMVRPENPFFARALVNRYWAHFFGRGIVEPVDDMRQTNPPSNPQLLDRLASEFVAGKFGLKQLVRSICTSKTYQLSSTPNETNRDDVRQFSRFLPRRLPAEVLLDAIDQATGNQTKFRVAGEKTPTELEIRAIERPHMRVSSGFLSVFGVNGRDSACECGRESNVTLAQRVMLLNNGEVQRKLATRAETLSKDSRPISERVRDSYLSFFSRQPTDEELATVVTYVETKSAEERNQQAVWQDVVWALLNSKEFVFQH